MQTKHALCPKKIGKQGKELMLPDDTDALLKH
jgi:hypothetical protein